MDIEHQLSKAINQSTINNIIELNRLIQRIFNVENLNEEKSWKMQHYDIESIT